MYSIGQYINGNHLTDHTEKDLDIINPAFDKIVGSLHFATKQQVEYAIRIADKSFQAWANHCPCDWKLILSKSTISGECAFF